MIVSLRIRSLITVLLFSCMIMQTTQPVFENGSLLNSWSTLSWNTNENKPWFNSWLWNTNKDQDYKMYHEAWLDGYKANSWQLPWKAEEISAFGTGAFLAAYIGLFAWVISNENNAQCNKEKEIARSVLNISTMLNAELKELEKVCAEEIPFEYSSLTEYLKADNILYAKNIGYAENLNVKIQLSAVLESIKNVVKQLINHKPECNSLSILKNELHENIKNLYAVLSSKLYGNNDLHDVVAKTLQLDVQTILFLQA